jgi:hypothetical protein
MARRERAFGDLDWINAAQERVVGVSCGHGNELSDSMKYVKFLGYLTALFIRFSTKQHFEVM